MAHDSILKTAALGISIETAKEHVQNLLRKTALDGGIQAAVRAIRHGIARPRRATTRAA